MHVSVIGSGYVGLVAGACLAETGNDVICADIDAERVANLKKGIIPIWEPGLDELIERNATAGRLQFTTDVAHATRSSDIIFIAVGTPPGEDGSADLQHVLKVAHAIGQAMNNEKIVITKSTVPVGTAMEVKQAIEDETHHPVHVCSNPEFLKEGAAIDDFMKPDRVVLGVDSDYAGQVLTHLYSPFVRSGNQILLMDIASAEITKYAANSMLATRISFMNSLSNLCDAAGGNIDMVRRGVGTDSRIGPAFLYSGCGYGGSCFSKDVKALTRTMLDMGLDASILEAVEHVNDRQKELLASRILDRFGPDLSGHRIAVWGLAFKPNTDDMRDAPSLVTIPALISAGAEVFVHDPVAIREARTMLGDSVTYMEDYYDTLQDADALVIHTEWLPYRRPDFDRIKEIMRRPVIFDGRNLYTPGRMADLGFEYSSIGRPSQDTK